jgi:hypothetical protein
MKEHKCITDSPARWAAATIALSAIWVFAPEIVQAAVAFGEIGQNVAENAKGVARGITMAGFAGGAGMGVWGCVDMYDASRIFMESSFVFLLL